MNNLAEDISLPKEVEESPPPRHVALIMDGNGRWGAGRGLPRTAGHLWGIRAARKVVEEARRTGVQFLTLFAFSVENWQRQPEEVSFIMNLLERYLRKDAVKLAKKGIRIKVIGDQALLPQSLLSAVLFAEEETAFCDEMELVLAISYGGQDELVKSAQSLATLCCSGRLHPSEIDRQVFEEHLFLPHLPPIDLLIRTGGEFRVSNFLLWHLAYAELIFLPLMWPEMTAKALHECIDEFRSRNRRYGRTA